MKMKLLKLKLKNINSLYGEFEIDFENPDFAENRLFVLTGPTGSGKTSVLDAICLALFGKTPRIASITKDKNAVLSKDTKYCFAELLFETGGKKYTSRWEQEVNRNGNLNKVKHQVCDADGVVLVGGDKLTEARDRIVDLIGLDFEQFVRTVMLTQGEFDRFLSSDSEDKAALFTKITGSEIYEKISNEVFDRFKDKKRVYNEFQSEIEGMELLPEERRAELAKLIEQYQRDKRDLEEERDQIKKGLDWHENVAKLEKILEEAEIEKRKIQAQILAFEPQKKVLEAADRAASIEVAFTHLLAEENKLTEAQKNLANAKGRLPEKEKSLEKAKEEETNTQEKLVAETKARDDARPGLLRVRSLDNDISHLQANKRTAKEKFEERKTALQRLQNTLSAKDTVCQGKKVEFSQSEKYFEIHAGDEKLAGALGGIESALSDWDKLTARKAKAEAEVLETQNKVAKSRENIEAHRTRAEKLQAEYDKIQKGLRLLESKQESLLAGETVQDIEKRRDELVSEIAAMRAVKGYEEQRRQLVEGQACPLCGSIHHPYVLGTVPSDNEKKEELKTTEKTLASVRSCFNEINKVGKTAAQMNADLVKAKNELKSAEDNIQQNVKACSEKERVRDELERDLDEKKKDLLNQLAGYGVVEGDFAETKAIFADLKKRHETWQRLSEERDKDKEEIDRLERDIAVLKKEKEKAREELENAEKDLKKSEDELSAKKKERFDLFGEVDPEKEEQRLDDRVKAAVKTNDAAKEAKNKAQSELTRCQDEIKRFSGEIDGIETVLKQRRDSFESDLKAKSFQTRAEFEKARLEPEERDRIRNRWQSLEEENLKLAGETEQARKTLQSKKDEKITDKTAEHLQAELKTIEGRRVENDQKLKDAEKELSIDERNREKVAELQKELDAAKGEFQKWDRLWTVLGRSSNAFSNFVQTLTFERVVQYANLWLKKMAPRYELKRRVVAEEKDAARRKGKKADNDDVNDTPTSEVKGTAAKSKVRLDLDVIDYEQGGEVRVVENLSGGERFMVSLALALGISRLAGKNVRIETLFLDEGFGTLDENALESAIDVLDHLQREEGKMIGIVTHVEKLRGEESRIQTQIQVIPQGGGRSVLSGPGVTRIKPPRGE